MPDNKQSTQLRFMLAAVLSLLVLFGWSYFFAPKKPSTDANANIAQATVTPTPAPVNQAAQPAQNQAVDTVSDNTPNKVLTIKSPLYEVKFDSKGALVTSWVLLKNVHGTHERNLYGDGANDGAAKLPLELISQKALEMREIPFRLLTGDANLDNLLNNRNYQLSIPDETVSLNGSDSKQIDFVLNDEASNLQVVKSFIFHGDSYLTDLGVKVLRGGQPVANTKLAVGASIGDQAVVANNYYHIEPEAVAFVGDKIERHPAASMLKSNEDQGNLTIGGDVDWAGVGDTYFAMAVIPAQKTQGLEFHTSKYQVDTPPFYDGIFAWITRTSTTKITKHLTTAFVPIAADGSDNKIYTGSKDYFTLIDYSTITSKDVGRTIPLEDFINYSNYSLIRSFVKPLSILLLRALSIIYGFVGNYGTAIIIFTLLFYSIFFPIRWYQSKSFKKAQSNAPKMKEIQDRLKELQKKGVASDDPRMREIQMEQLRLTKDALPIGGCLPLLLQMPLFFAFYTAVTISIDFRQASFLWLPDLSAADPYHVLNFLFAASMAGSMIFTPTTPTVTSEQKTQQKMMTYMMPVMMLWLMWGSPAGLLLYWFFGNIVSFVQQFFINRISKNNQPPDTIEVKALNKNVNLSTS